MAAPLDLPNWRAVFLRWRAKSVLRRGQSRRTVECMNADEIIATQAWIRRWAELGDLPRRSSSEMPLCQILPQFNDAFRAALALHPPAPWSGLIEQQAIFSRARR